MRTIPEIPQTILKSSKQLPVEYIQLKTKAQHYTLLNQSTTKKLIVCINGLCVECKLGFSEHTFINKTRMNNNNNYCYL